MRPLKRFPCYAGRGRTERGRRIQDERMTVAGAADRLGITKEAVRKRISRGSLRSDKDQDGTVRVYIPASGTTSGTASPAGDRDELVEELRDQVRYLRGQLDQERDANRENRRIIAGLTQRIPELEAASSSEPPEASQTVEEEPDRAKPRPATPDPQTGAQRRPLWRRIFGR